MIRHHIRLAPRVAASATRAPLLPGEYAMGPAILLDAADEISIQLGPRHRATVRISAYDIGEKLDDDEAGCTAEECDPATPFFTCSGPR